MKQSGFFYRAVLSAGILLATSAPAMADEGWTGLKLGLGVSGQQTRTHAEGSGSHYAAFAGDGVWEESSGAVTGEGQGKKSGIVLSAEAGYDLQLGGNLVAGLVGSFDFTRGKRASASFSEAGPANYGLGCDGSNTFYDPGCTFSYSADGRSAVESSVAVKNAVALGARLGFVAGKNTLLYATGGWTGAKVSEVVTYSTSATVPTRTGGPILFNGSAAFEGSKFRSGSFWGGGIEHKFGSSYSVKFEYRQSDYGHLSGDWTGVFEVPGHFGTMSTASEYGDPLALQRRAGVTQRALRVGLSYQF